MGVRKESVESQKPEIERIMLSSLKPRRRGKHHVLMEQILKELTGLSGDSALKVPLGGYSAKHLRSAVVRAAASQNLQISSTSDEANLYVWKRPS